MLPETRKRFLRLAKATGVADNKVLAAVADEDDARLPSVLVTEHGCDKNTVLQILGEVYRLPAVDVVNEELENALLKSTSADFWQRSLSMPMREEEGYALVVMADPEELPVVDEITAVMAKPVRMHVGLAHEILQYIQDWGGGLRLESLVSDLVNKADGANKPRMKTTTKSEAGSPAVWLIDNLLTEAVNRGVEEVYLIPFPEGDAHARFKLATKIVERKTYPLALHKKVVGRLRVLADLLGKATLEPQNGSYLVQIQNKTYLIEVMIVPAEVGDAVTLFLNDAKA